MKRPDAFKTQISTIFVEQHKVPTDFFTDYEENDVKEHYDDLCEKHYQGDSIYIYKMVRVEYHLAFKSIMVPLAAKLLHNLFKNNYNRSIASQNQWINLSEEMIQRILDGEVETADVAGEFDVKE